LKMKPWPHFTGYLTVLGLEPNFEYSGCGDCEQELDSRHPHISQLQMFRQVASGILEAWGLAVEPKSGTPLRPIAAVGLNVTFIYLTRDCSMPDA
jgi:hypothetical protein